MEHKDIVHERVIHRVLRRQAEKYGNREFFRFKELVFGFEDFDRESDRVAAGLQGLGIRKGDRVAIVMGNRPEFLFLWFGLSKLGAIEVPINTAHRGNLLTYMIEKAGCKMVVVESEYLDRLGPVLKVLPKVEKIVVLCTEGAPIQILEIDTFDFNKVVDNKGAYDPIDVLWSDPFKISFTSGTTGPSKGALMPQNYAIFMAEVISSSGNYNETDCLYNALPLFHGNAQVLSTMPALMSGAKMCLADRFSASRFWNDVKDHDCTEFNYLGSIISILNKADPKPDDANNPLRVMIGGGCPSNLWHDFEKRFGLTIIEGYGMSELGLPFMSTFDKRKPGTCGIPRSDYDVKLVDDDGMEIEDNTPGELIVRPLKPFTMMLEYYKMPEQTVAAWQDLWFRTGDYLRRDEEGFYHFVDRKKDALRRRGENISSYEVEQTINSHPAVLESAAIPIKSDIGEDEVMVCLTTKSGFQLAPEKLIAHCETHMAYFMVPRYLRFMDALPRTSTERIQKYILRDEGVTSDTWDREKTGYKLKR